MKNALSPLIHTIKTGKPDEIRQAKKDIEAFWRKVYRSSGKPGKNAFTLFLTELTHFNQIKDVDHQAHFIHVLKWAFWMLGQEHFETWVDFVLQTIQHPSGKVRQATVLSADILLLNLNRVDMTKPSQINSLSELVDVIRFGYYVYSVEMLIEKYQTPKLNRYKYVSSMPPGVYKSLQKLITETILRTKYQEDTYEFYWQQFGKLTMAVYTGNYSRDVTEMLKLLLQPSSKAVH